MVMCAVYGCSHQKERCDRYFKFPVVKESNFEHFEIILKRRNLWFQALRRSDITERDIEQEAICKCHFISGRPAQLLEVNEVDWVPTLKIPKCEEDTDSANKSHKRKLIKKFSRIPGKPYAWSVNFSSRSDNVVENVATVKPSNDAATQTKNPSSIRTKNITLVDAETQTDITGDYFDQLRIKTAQLLHLRDKVVSVQLTKINMQQFAKSKNGQNITVFA